jgi:hypothetical protein
MESKKKRSKKAQVTIFVIIGIVIIGLAILVYLFYPKIRSTLGFAEENPSQFLQRCLEDDVLTNLEILSSQGGSLNPEHYYLYQDEKLEYLCYTEEYFLPCVVQKPLLERSIENEIEIAIQSQFNACLEDMKNNFEGRGYRVNIEEEGLDVELLPEFVGINFGSSITLTKGEDVQRYNTARANIRSDLFDLVSIAGSILNWEASYGDAETTAYMDYYRDLKVEKYKQSDGTTVYILTNRDSEDKFQFASRSVAWPPGYGASLI